MDTYKIRIETKNRQGKRNYQTSFVLPSLSETKKMIKSSRLLLSFCRDCNPYINNHALKGKSRLELLSDANCVTDYAIICNNQVIGSVQIEREFIINYID